MCDQNLESAWQEWTPDTGAYMNEVNPFNLQFNMTSTGAALTNCWKLGGSMTSLRACLCYQGLEAMHVSDGIKIEVED